MAAPIPARPKDKWTMGIRIQPDARIRLICFPHAGAGSTAYRRWTTLLPEHIDIVAMRLPGREDRINEPCLDRIEDVLPAFAEALGAWSDKPMAFFGHSMGAVLAFELCRHLRRLQRPMPRHLFVSGYQAPQLHLRSDQIHGLSDAEFLKALQERYQGIPPQLLQMPEILELFTPILRADITLLERYQCAQEPALPCPMTAMGGELDPWTTTAYLQPWGALTTGRFTMRTYPGDHFYLSPLTAAVANDIAADLDAAI